MDVNNNTAEQNKFDKIYDLLELVYVELQNTKTELRDEIDNKTHSLKYELKTDISELRSEVKSDMKNLRTELKEDMNNLRTELKGDMADFRQEVNTRFDKLEEIVSKHDVEIKVIKAAK